MLDLFKLHGTKILGFLGVTVSVLAVADPAIIGGPTAIKYFLLAQSLLTVWRGFFNGEVVKLGIEAKKQQQGGFIRLLLLVSMLVIASVAVTSVVSGCTSTRAAYKEASSVDEVAYVVAEHYSALVHEAANLKQIPTTPPELVTKMQEIDRTANPAVHKLREARDVYLAGKSAKTAADLQVAVNDAVRLVADFGRLINSAKVA